MVNQAKVIKKIIIKADIKTCSPLRIGSGETDGITDILILKDKQGRAFIPATSLAGVLRAKTAAVYSEAAAEKLFGRIGKDDSDSNANQSMINISDIILESGGLIHRDGVKINEITGVGEKGAKYDFEALDRGAHGRLNIEITIRQHDLDTAVQMDMAHNGVQDSYSEMAYTIADLLSSGIQVGSLTTKGYGEIKSDKAKCYEFDFTQKTAAQNWLSYLDDQNKVPKESYIGKNRQNILGGKELCIEADFALQNSLIVRDYDENNIASQNETDNITAVQMTSGGDYIIPGTGLKGALRNKAFDILMTLTGNDESRVQKKLNDIMGFANEQRQANGDVKSSGRRSNLYIKDIYISKDKLHSMKQTRNRIDRFTGGTIDSALFSEEPIWQTDKNVPYIHMSLRVKDCDEAQVGLMLLILRELWQGNLPIGGGKSIGRGVLHGRKCAIQYKDADKKEHKFSLEQKDNLIVIGDKNLLESYVQKLAGECNG